jgi:rRNA biogenesis protein RRP5
MDFRVHHKSAAGILVQLPSGGFGRVTKEACGGDVLADRLFAHASQQNDDVIVCGPTGATDADGYHVYSTDLRRTCSAARWAGNAALVDVLVDLAKRNAVCGLGRSCRARVVSQRDEGAVLRLPNGMNAVVLGKLDEGTSDTLRDELDDDAVTDAASVAAPSFAIVRILAYDERGSSGGVATCTAAPEVVAGAHRSYQELANAGAALACGAVVTCRAMLTIALSAGPNATRKFVVAHHVRGAESAGRGIGHSGADVPASKVDLLVYVPLADNATPPALGSLFHAQLTYVPSPTMIIATPFCVASAVEPKQGPSRYIGVPNSRLIRSAGSLHPVVVPLPWRDPVLNAQADNAGDEDDEGLDQRVRRRRVEEALDKFERQGEVAPTTPDEFEKQLLATPYNSYLWTQFMALHISLRRVEAARSVAEKALARIPVTEPKELLNVWVAYLNLENSYGTPESLAVVFRRAIERNDDKLAVHERLADIFAATGKKAQLVDICKTMTNKFRKEPRVWERYANALVDTGKRDQVRRVFKYMGDAISSKEQTLIMVHVAIHEYRQGSPEHGRALFESLVAKQPKRSDVWSAYIDQERGLLARGATEASVTGLRLVYERVSTLSLPPKVMQAFLTQWLTFEQAHGTPALVQKVKDKARAYVEARASAVATAVGGAIATQQ